MKGHFVKFCKDSGYMHSCVHVNGKQVKLRQHRIVAKAYCANPTNEPEVDHIDGDPCYNHAVNLRYASHANNMKNTRLRKDNTSGTTGVRFDKKEGKWVAFIQVKGSPKRLGCFTDKAAAIKARSEAAIKYDFHPNHGQPKPKQKAQ